VPVVNLPSRYSYSHFHRLGHKMARVMTTRVVLALLSPLVCLGDLPVHCLRHQIVGNWEFELSPMQNKRSSCGHGHPDAEGAQPSLQFFQSLGQTEIKRFTVQDPNTVTSEEGTAGTWTMIYDEGFEVAIGDEVFFAFSKFEYVQDANTGERVNVSHCDQTEVGWYHNLGRNLWGCYTGRKVDAIVVDASTNDNHKQITSITQTQASPPKESLSSISSQTSAAASDTDQQGADDESSDTANQASDNGSDSNNQAADEGSSDTNNQDSEESAQDTAPSPPPPALTEIESTQAEWMEPVEYKPWVPSEGFDKPMASAWQQSVAEALNFLQLGWHATVYDMFLGKTPRQLNKLAGVRRNIPRHPIRRHQKASKFNSFLSVATRTRRSVGGDSFDWRHKDGRNWLEAVVSQGDCGSCYTIATVHMLTARNKIRTGNINEPTFSVSFPLYCSEYNQGCDGGYGFLQSKWSEDIGLVPEQCAPFSQGGGTCQLSANCDMGATRYRASNHRYIGGYYGGGDAELIQQELVNNGPLVMSFEPKEDFMYYKAGIYKSGPNRIHQEWEQVDHAVLLSGYGSEKGQPYWTMQNSWGNSWGEAGFFRMARGIDESGCESIAVAADVTTESDNKVLDQFLANL